jgi:hypothetical protein
LIISNIIGGIGNQMFQYAIARKLALQRSDSFLLDISEFSTSSIHQGFELNRVFNCNAAIATNRQIQNTLGWQSPKFVRRIVKQKLFSHIRRKEFVIEPGFFYWPDVEQVPTNCYLIGNWQSERYFKAIEHIIREDFAFTRPLSEQNSHLANEIRSLNSVSLHIRRGDYAHNQVALNTHGLLPLSYYNNAISLIGEKVATPTLFIFSDDANWAKLNLKTSYHSVFVDNNHGSESYVDMQLMSLCKHNIIANSSFSWWGAWLNCNPHKVVIAPRRWFVNEPTIHDHIPEQWILL